MKAISAVHRKIWNGQVSLKVLFWFGAFLVPFALRVLYGICNNLALRFPPIFNPPVGGIVWALGYVFLFLYALCCLYVCFPLFKTAAAQDKKTIAVYLCYAWSLLLLGLGLFWIGHIAMICYHLVRYAL